MLEIIKFIFSSFWIWLGTVIILGIIFGGIYDVIKIGISKSFLKINKGK